MPQTIFFPKISTHIPSAPSSIDHISVLIFQFAQAKTLKSHLCCLSCFHTPHLICQEALTQPSNYIHNVTCFRHFCYHSVPSTIIPCLDGYKCFLMLLSALVLPHSNQNAPSKMYVKPHPSFSPSPSNGSHLRGKARVLFLACSVTCNLEPHITSLASSLAPLGHPSAPPCSSQKLPGSLGSSASTFTAALRSAWNVCPLGI